MRVKLYLTALAIPVHLLVKSLPKEDRRQSLLSLSLVPWWFLIIKLKLKQLDIIFNSSVFLLKLEKCWWIIYTRHKITIKRISASFIVKVVIFFFFWLKFSQLWQHNTIKAIWKYWDSETFWEVLSIEQECRNRRCVLEIFLGVYIDLETPHFKTATLLEKFKC